MRRFALVNLVCCLGLTVPGVAHAQVVVLEPRAQATPSDQQAPTSQQTPPQQTPPQQTPPAQTTPAAPSSDSETTRSLFEPTWRQFLFGGRWTSVSGDEARFERYQDLGSGVLFSDARYSRDDPNGYWQLRAAADSVGWRDQRYVADYDRTGRFRVAGYWDQIPQFYSIDTKTAYTGSGGTLVLDDATQQRVQNGQFNPPLSAYLPISPQFDLREQRDVGHVSFVATPTPQIDLTASFNMIRHSGELPWGASFGFGNDVEVPLPYDSRTNDFTVGAEWTNLHNMIRVGYEGSWFNNLDDTLVWDSPLRLTDSTSAPGRGRMALWPTNSAQTVSVAGYTKFAHRTQLTGFLSYGLWSNDQPLQPFTINAALPQLTLPRTSAEAEAGVFSANLNFVSHPVTNWRFNARFREYSYDNQTPQASIPQFINYDTSVTTSSTGGPELYAHGRTTFDADATWSGLPLMALTAGYTRDNSSHEFRIFEDTGENVLRLRADAVGSQWVTFRADYQLSDRSGSGLNEELLTEIGEQPDMRHYDLANRTRNKFTGQVDVTPNDMWTFSASTGLGKDDYKDSYFGLQDLTFRTFSVAVDYHSPNGFGAGVSYNYEDYEGDQRSRQASPGSTPPQEDDPNRDWTVDSKERVNYFSIYLAPPRFGKTEARVSYDYNYAKGDYFYGIVPGGPLTPPNQLPDVFNKLQQFRLDIRHRLTNHLAANLTYLYEPFRVYDFAFDRTVINSIVQPSSLVMGYVYRPYTANSAVIGVRYFW